MNHVDWRPAQRIKNNLIYGIICGLLWLVRHLPASLIERLGHILGNLGYYLDAHDRKQALKNLDLAFGDTYTRAEKKEICRKSFIHLGLSAAEMFTFSDKLAANPTLLEISPADRQHWQELLKNGRGIVAMTGHFGNWEILARVITTMGGEIYTVAKQLYDPRLTKLVEEQRGLTGLKILWRVKHRSLRTQMADLLRQGAIMAILNDQRFKVPGQILPFFGHPAKTATGAATLAFQTGAPVIAGGLFRQEDGHYKLIMVDIPRPDTTDEETFVTAVNSATNQFYEKIIRQYPDQWVWLHNRWKL